ncbi:transporter substrate-binding domain-containing protein [Geomonas sp. Red32]|uniref:transporter substrate-binding domain-containing protein n=1 Tax=Geomonas sp. Red32 TaxID=2912856 RepID=UPI00202CE77B|nr:transporter substrate-binding domain-containing protein [Geomonas sp. Red32]MCM0080416.1 transporter substrate-binding domain-containing protein [Geomonas sp. Red32]
MTLRIHGYRFSIPSGSPRFPALDLHAAARWAVGFLWLTALLFAVPSSWASGSAPAAAPASSKTIVVGGNWAYPPYEFLDAKGKPAGYNVDLTRAIADVMGIKVEFRFDDWSKLRADLPVGKIDILQGVSFSEERSQIIDFSPPHTIVHHSIFARKGTPPVSKLEDLRGKKVIVFADGIMHDTLRRLGFGPNLVLTRSPADELRLLASGQCDYAVVATLPGMFLINQHHLTNVVQVAKNVAAEKYCYGVAKGNAELITRFSEGLAILKQNGQYEAIYDRWLGINEQRLTPDRVAKYGAMVLLPLLAILIATGVWSRTLQKRVEERTNELAQEVAERNRALEELRLHQDKLIQADKMATLGVLVAGVAHEINNPNGLILLNLPILKDVYHDATETLETRFQHEGDFMLGGLNYSRMRDEVPLMLEDMSEGAARIKRIVEDLKNYARQDSTPRMEPFDLNSVVQAAVRLMETSIRKSTNNFDCRYGRELPKVLGSPQRIEQVVVNLLINACQALPSPEQGIRIETSADRETGVVRLTVTDQGVGIPQEFLHRLTDPFFTTKRESGGTGLGLSISAGIVQEHGGTLSFDSEPGHGTTATLTLNAQQGADAA